MAHFETLHDLLIQQLHDIHDAEVQLSTAMHRMAAAAKSPALRDAFDKHQKETQEHIARIREVFAKHNITPSSHACQPMRAMVEDAMEVATATGDPDVMDAALIAAAQRIEHYEIAAYGCVIAFAHAEELGNIESLAGESIKEEGNFDKLLTKIALGGLLRKSVNQEAAKA